MGGGVGVFGKEFQSAPVNCKADRLSAFCTSSAKTSAIRTRHDKTTLLVTKGDNGHFRTLLAITYKKILNKLNAILAAYLHLLATFGLECRAFACKKKKNHLQQSGGGGGGKRPPAPPRPPPMYFIPNYVRSSTSIISFRNSLILVFPTLVSFIFIYFLLFFKIVFLILPSANQCLLMKRYSVHKSINTHLS